MLFSTACYRATALDLKYVHHAKVTVVSLVIRGQPRCVPHTCYVDILLRLRRRHLRRSNLFSPQRSYALVLNSAFHRFVLRRVVVTAWPGASRLNLARQVKETRGSQGRCYSNQNFNISWSLSADLYLLDSCT